MGIKIGLLDFGIRKEEIAGMHTIEDVINYAIKADELGFSRFWLAEHHVLSTKYAWNNPELLLPIIAASTDKIRVGIAGILLGLHSTYRIASSFKFLSNIFPNRIDLGFAKGTPENIKISKNLNPMYSIDGITEENFYDKVNEVLYFLNDERSLLESDKIVIPPFQGSIPTLWGLGSSINSLKSYIQKDMNFVLSTFHGNQWKHLTRETFSKIVSENIKNQGQRPEIIVALSGVCASTVEEANAIKRLPDPFAIVGTPEIFSEVFQKFTELFDVKEFIFMDSSLHSPDRLQGLELLSSLFKMTL